MDPIEIIATRKSVRTFDGRPLAAEDLQTIVEFARGIENPWGIPVEFVVLDAAEHGLSSKVINGESTWIAGKVAKVPHCEEAFGFTFEKMVLHACSLGVGTTWVGGTFERDLFEKAAQKGADELMPVASPLGYPADEPAEIDAKLRASVKGDERKPALELFFDGSFGKPLAIDDPDIDDALFAVRWSPSAANMQPTRVVRAGSSFHFYEEHTKGYAGSAPWDVQRIDVGIAICHFMEVAGGSLSIADPGIAVEEDVEYIATVTV